MWSILSTLHANYQNCSTFYNCHCILQFQMLKCRQSEAAKRVKLQCHTNQIREKPSSKPWAECCMLLHLLGCLCGKCQMCTRVARLAALKSVGHITYIKCYRVQGECVQSVSRYIKTSFAGCGYQSSLGSSTDNNIWGNEVFCGKLHWQLWSTITFKLFYD